MNFCEKIITLRKSKGYSQEQLANILNVSRQAVSKWESGQSTPELSKIITLAEIFEVSVDYLVRDNHKEEEKCLSNILSAFSYEYKSKTKIRNIPLVHINLGFGLKKAKGIIAIGNIAIGVISLGCVSLGVLSFGAFCIGLLIALGAISIGTIALGGISLGILSIGACSIGIYSLGALSIGKKVAVGAAAIGETAIGKDTNGEFMIKITDNLSKEEVRNFILQNNKGIMNFILNILTLPFH